MPNKNELQPGDLRCLCDPAMFDFDSTLDIEPLDQVIGQERAVHALEFGLDMKSPGYNIFVTGPEGTGKTTIVRDIVGRHAQTLPVPVDWCMVNNFKDQFRPKAIPVPTGAADRFAKSMNRFIQDLKTRLPKEFEKESFREKIMELQKKYGRIKRDIYEKLNQSAKEKSLMINKTQAGYQTIPMKEDKLKENKPLSPDEYKGLSKDEQAQIEKNIHDVQAEIENVIREMNRINQAQQKDILQLTEQVAIFVVKNRLDIIRDNYTDCPEILAHLDKVQKDIVESVERFVVPPKSGDKGRDDRFQSAESALNRYKVNVLVDRSSIDGAPVVFEPNPTYQNVFGRIEKKTYMGMAVTDFTMVQSGSLLQANGGFLILEIEAVLAHPYVWEALKRALQNKMLFIEDLPTGMGFGTASLRPEPIPMDVTVILLGGYAPFQILQNHDSKFNKIFKVRADFDNEVIRTEDTIHQYAQFVARVCRDEQLLPFLPGSVAAVVEYGEKTIASKSKLSLRFGFVEGIIKEADYWARKENAARVSDRHVVKAFTEYRFRYNLYEEKMHENYVDETIMIDVAGKVVGQVNALAVYQIGDIAFGRPSRITAETYMGKSGVINIEREAKLSGKTHDKGVLILSGYMGRTFAQKYPLSLSISITFEQSYGGIDGDSASSTELYAVLSSLSKTPIRQGIAVTGSVNQKGKIQAIGGVNHKIEGFFDVCEAKGLSGGQGVMIPRANVKNLMLKREIIEAVEKGRFHIYQVSTVEEGIEILTGKPAGVPDAEGNYPDDSVFGKIRVKLEQYLKQSLGLKKAFGFEDE